MQHEHLHAMLFEARRHELEDQARQARLVAEVRRHQRRMPTRRLSRLRRALAPKGRVGVSVEELA
ncbi:MAG: hypothetical protein ACRDVN_06905 [Jiangellaceae bacterium]